MAINALDWFTKMTGSNVNTTSTLDHTEIDPITQQSKEVLTYSTEMDRVDKGMVTSVDSSKGTIDSTITSGEAIKIDYTAQSVKHFASSVTDILKAGASISNGYISKMSADAKARTYKFQAEQDKHSAELLLKNQKDITRAAQMDANRYRIAGAETKAKQITGMAGTGFAVGKGVFKNTLSTTEARVNYNVSNIMLKAGLENAELTRKAGTLEANAIIAEANAKIAKQEGKFAVFSGWVNGISNLVSACANFYCGGLYNGNWGGSKPATNNTKGS